MFISAYFKEGLFFILPLYLFVVAFVLFAGIFSFEDFVFFLARYHFVLLFHKFFPVISFILIIGISCFGDSKGFVEIMHCLKSMPFDYTRQADFQKVYFLVLAVNPALQFPFLCNRLWQNHIKHDNTKQMELNNSL